MDNNYTSQKYYPGFDLLKFVLAIFIIGSHTGLFCEFAVLHTFISHVFDIAVPTFFTISAFLFYNKIEGKPPTHCYRVFSHTMHRYIVFYMIWWLIMLPMSYFTFFSSATLKEILFAGILRSTFGGYWFIKALIINIVILYVCRRGLLFNCFIIISFLLYLIFAYNYKFHFFNLPFSPYFSFFYQTVYFGIGALLVKLVNSDTIHVSLSLYRCTIAIFLLIILSYTDVGEPLSRLIYPLVLVPFFLRLEFVGNELFKKMRISSSIMYMTQFALIWIYDLLIPSTSSILKFIVVLSIALLLSYIIIELEKKPRFSFLSYLH